MTATVDGRRFDGIDADVALSSGPAGEPEPAEDLVLVVDDEPGMRDTVSDILEMHGLVAAVCGSGREALARRAGLHPAVAVIDHGLPDMTGLELCSALKADDRDLQVVLLTGQATLENAIAAVGQADEFLTKPVHPEELVRVIKGALFRRRLRRENEELVIRLREVNARLEASILDRTNDLAGLASLAEAIAQGRGVDEVVEAVVSNAAAATGAVSAGVYVIDESTGVSSLRGSWPSEQPLPGRSPSTPAADPALVVSGADGDIWLPLFVGGQRLGSLLLRRPIRVTAPFLQTLAVEAAVALQNAQRFARERETVERLSEVSRLKSAFLASVSHELRTPLTAVVGFAQTLGNYGEQLSVDDRGHMISRIVVQGERLRRLIDNLLDSTALETGTLRISVAAVDGPAIIRRVVDGLGERSATVRVITEPDLPPVWSDEGRLEQVLGNLIDNAVKHGDPEQPITVTASSIGDQVVFGVADHGPGIDPAFLPSLFDPFSQGDNSDSRRGKGVGLGLFIARGLVAAMGGDIEVASRAGGGTVVRVLLPRAQA